MLARASIPLLLLLAVAIVPQPAGAVNLPAYTLVVPCWASGGVSSGPLVTLPSGVYAVTIEGACDFGVATSPAISQPVNTPCNAPPVYNVPCVSGASVDVPMAACFLSVGVAYTYCGISNGVANCHQYVAVNGQCFPLGAGLLSHGGGSVSARYVDGHYADNVGAFTVTFTLTPL